MHYVFKVYVPFHQRSENEQNSRTYCSPPWLQELISFSQLIVGAPENWYKERKKETFIYYNF